jgi:hypothetical protein
MNEATRITQQELQPLPRWARLAFAARCLRRAWSQLRAPAEQVRVLGEALAHVEQAGAAGAAGDEVADAAASAYTLALDNLDGKAGAPAGEDETVFTCLVAHATAFTAEAATLSDARAAAHLIAQGVDFAVHAFRVGRSAEAGAAVAAMRADLQRCREAAAREGWHDQSPVGPASFGAA